VTDDEAIRYGWVYARTWKWRNRRGYGSLRYRVAHILGPRPEFTDQREVIRTQPWPALCGLDVRFGYEADAPISTYPWEKACERCVKVAELVPTP